MAPDQAVGAVPQGQRGRPFRDHRQVVEGIVYRFRTRVACRDLSNSFGPWQTVCKRHKRFSTDGTWDKIHSRLVAEARTPRPGSSGRSRSTPRSTAHDQATTLSRIEEPAGRPRHPQGADLNYRDPRTEPPDHALGPHARRDVDQEPPACLRPWAPAGPRSDTRPVWRFTHARAVAVSTCSPAHRTWSPAPRPDACRQPVAAIARPRPTASRRRPAGDPADSRGHRNSSGPIISIGFKEIAGTGMVRTASPQIGIGIR